jgi:hypothetical protein
MRRSRTDPRGATRPCCTCTTGRPRTQTKGNSARRVLHRQHALVAPRDALLDTHLGAALAAPDNQLMRVYAVAVLIMAMPNTQQRK